MKFELKEYNRNTPDSEFIADVSAVAKKLGQDTVTQQDYSQHGKYHVSTLTRRSKSYANFSGN